MFVHCSANHWVSPGVVIEAANEAAAVAEYRKRHSVPAGIQVQTEEVSPLPNGSFAKVRRADGG